MVLELLNLDPQEFGWKRCSNPQEDMLGLGRGQWSIESCLEGENGAMEMMDKGAPRPPESSPSPQAVTARLGQGTSHVLGTAMLLAEASCAWVSLPCSITPGWVCVSRGREEGSLFFVFSRRWD